MPKMKVDGFIDAFQCIVEGLEASRKKAAPKLKKALQQWAENTAEDATAGLRRPTWLLSKSIEPKLKEYQNNGKIWAIAGFKFSSKEDKRTPGYYGQFHEAGWAPHNRKPTAPDHFLKKAKEANTPKLQKETEQALKQIDKTIAEKIRERRNERG